MFRSGSSGEVQAVKTSKNTLYSKKAVVIAAGCWTGSLIHDLIRDSSIQLDVPVKPRKVESKLTFLHSYKCLLMFWLTKFCAVRCTWIWCFDKGH